MKRCQFMRVIGGAAAWPVVVHAQSPERVRHVGVLIHVAESDPDRQAHLTVFLQGLSALGWAFKMP